MKRAILPALGLTLALAAPARAEHVDIAFRNPIASDPAPRAGHPFTAMVAAQLYDAENSAIHIRRGYIERNPQYQWCAHGGALGYVAAFALEDAAELTIAHALHVNREQVERLNVEQSANGILETNGLGHQ